MKKEKMKEGDNLLELINPLRSKVKS